MDKQQVPGLVIARVRELAGPGPDQTLRKKTGPRRIGPLGAPVLLLIVLCTGWSSGVASAATHHHPKTSLVLSPSGITAIVKAYNTTNNQANQTLNTSWRAPG